MAKVKFRRLMTNAEVDKEPIVDGQFIVTKEGGTYIDYGTERVPTNTTIDKALNIASFNAVSNNAVTAKFDETKQYIDDNTRQDVVTGTITKCGYKIDGKDVYVERVHIGALPNAKEQEYEVPGLIWNNINIISIDGIYGGNYPINLAVQSEYFIATFVRSLGDSPNTFISINCGINRSDLDGYVNIYFTYK